MKKIFNFMLAATMCAATITTTSCKGNDPEVPNQKEIETKIIGKWKRLNVDGKDVVTNNREVFTFKADGTGSHSMSFFHPIEKRWVWNNKLEMVYSVTNNKICIKQDVTLNISVDEIKESHLLWTVESIIANGTDIKDNNKVVSKKISSDYSTDIIGLWEGVEITGYETYGNAEARIEYRADGTYTYYKKEGDYWVPSADADNEYNVDGDWLATRWRPEAGADYNYEWWDIDEIKGDEMKWSALREKEDGTRFNTTFTWKRIYPSQEEIEAKIVGKWKRDKCNGVDILTNDKHIDTYAPDGVLIGSMSKEKDGVWSWANKVKMNYSVEGNILHRKSSMIESWTEVSYIDNATMTELSNDRIFVYLRVTADYSDAILGMWEGVEMTGYETYGNAEARIEYRADGTYTYYKKEGDYWVPSADADNEWNVDGDWLATRWRPESGADYNYEWWDIDYIKGDEMKWSALREKEDGTRFTTTFTWKKVVK